MRRRIRLFTLTQLLSIAMVLAAVLVVAFTGFATIAGFPDLHSLFQSSQRQDYAPPSTVIRVQVDLGYEIYEGIANFSTELSVFKG